MHAQIEEEIFYPCGRKAIGEELIDEALEEDTGAAYGFVGMGPYSGGQAELLRLPDSPA